MIQIQKFTFNPFAENTYLIWDDKTNDALVIDPGCSDEFEETKLSDFVSHYHLKIKFLVNTHCHIDHILGDKFVKAKFDPTFMIPKEDLPLLQNAVKQAEMFGMEINTPPLQDQFIREDLTLFLNESKINFIFTPGHTMGEYCLYLEKEKILFSGDVLFKEGIGRTDLWGGDYNTLIHSIQSKIMQLPPDVKVFPGHGEGTTIGYELKNNPFLKQ